MVSVDWRTVGPAIVGVTFLWTAGIKAVAPRTFGRHLTSLGLFPASWVSGAVIATAGVEAFIGAALILGLSPGLLLPSTALLILLLSAVSLWGVRSGRTEDCGCYGGYIQPSIWQSLGLNSFYILLLIVPYWSGNSSAEIHIWKCLLASILAFAFGALALVSSQYGVRNNRPLFDLRPLKPGKRFRASWANGATRGKAGELLVAYLGPDCPHCAGFVKLGNAMNESKNLPKVIGVVGSTPERRDAFIQEKDIRFPVTVLSPSLMSRLTEAVPTAVLVRDGRIERIWVGEAPPDFVDRFRKAFFPDLVTRAGSSV
jgi:hypothetical protein